MYFNFNTQEPLRAKSALLIYAIYKSRDINSPLNGLETWNRAESFCKGACLKSSSTSEFVTKFKEMAKVGAIKPCYLSNDTNGDNIVMLSDGSAVSSEIIKNFQIDILENDDVKNTIEKEYPLIIMLVRERIQREKIMGGNENENFED